MRRLAADLARALDPVALAAALTAYRQARAVVSGRLAGAGGGVVTSFDFSGFHALHSPARLRVKGRRSRRASPSASRWRRRLWW